MDKQTIKPGLRSQTKVILSRQIKSRYQQLRSVNEQYCQDAIKLARDFFTDNDYEYERLSLALDRRINYDKAVVPLQVAFDDYKDDDKATLQNLYNALTNLYKVENLGESVIPIHISFNISCGSCKKRILKEANRVLSVDIQKQVDHVNKLLTEMKDLNTDYTELTGEALYPCPRYKKKRGRPKKETTTKMAQESGQNEPEDKNEPKDKN